MYRSMYVHKTYFQIPQRHIHIHTCMDTWDIDTLLWRLWVRNSVPLYVQEYQENGPLFSELKFYQRAAKPESSE